MNKDINLLPVRPNKPYDLYIFIPLGILIVVASLVLGLIQYMDNHQYLQQLEQEIAAIEQLSSDQIEEIQQSKVILTEDNYIVYYDRLSQFLRERYIPPQHITTRLEAALPAGSSLESLQFQRSGQVFLLVSFSSRASLATYIDTLNDLEVVWRVDVPSIVMINEGLEYQVQMELEVQTQGGDSL